MIVADFRFQIAKLRIMFRTAHTANTAELTNIAFIQPDMRFPQRQRSRFLRTTKGNIKSSYNDGLILPLVVFVHVVLCFLLPLNAAPVQFY